MIPKSHSKGEGWEKKRHLVEVQKWNNAELNKGHEEDKHGTCWCHS